VRQEDDRTEEEAVTTSVNSLSQHFLRENKW